MKKSYKVKINQGSEKSTIVEIPATANQAVKIKSLPQAKYLLVDETTGMAPDNIRVKRIGKDLSISFSGSNASDLLITDYYENTVAGFNAVIGEAEPDIFHAYIPESGEGSSTVASLLDGGKPVGMALGGDQVVASGAAVGALVAAAGFNPLWAAPLALLGAGGGGGGGGERDTTRPKITAAKLAGLDDTGASNSDGITSDDTPRLLISADADAVSATVTIGGKTYTSTTKNEQGQFVVQIPDDGALGNGEVTYSAKVKDAAGNESEAFAGTPFVVDKSSGDNFKPLEKDLNKDVSAQIVSIDADTGFSTTDFKTADNTLTFNGSVSNTFLKNGDLVELNLLDSTGKVLASQYVEPVNKDGKWGWSWDYSAQKLPDGAYKLKAQVVDKAGNAVGTLSDPQTITIDTRATGVTAAKLAAQDDTGVSNSDGITSDNTPRLLISADSDAVSAEVTIQGKTYTSATKNEQGQFVLPIDDALNDGVQAYTVVVKDAAGNVSEPLAGTPFVVDKSSDNNYDPAKNPAAEKDPNKGISVQIVSIDADTGVFKTDFVTADNTLTFNGSVGDTFDKNGDLVEVQLLDSADKLVASKYVEPVKPGISGGQWGWSWDYSAQKLPDGTYKLTAQVVDKAGNAVGAGPVQQNITVDTNAKLDPNSNFSIAVTRLDQDSGASASDFLTNQTALSFKGNIGNNNTGFTGKVLVQVLDSDGKVKSQAYVDPSSDGTWSYDNKSQSLGVSGANSQYVLKASLVDLAGNIFKSTDQSFTVDRQTAHFFYEGGATSATQVDFTGQTLSLTAAEPGVFSYPQNTGKNYFEKAEFSIMYTDWAGNISQPIINALPWKFSDLPLIVEIKPTSSPLTFGNGELAGSIGQYILKTDELTLNLSALHTPSPQPGSVAAINHIGLSGSSTVVNTAHTLNLTTGDVLALGVKNSFISNGHLQMRIDGDSADKVVLDNLLGGSTYGWAKSASQTLNGSTYLLYSNADLGLDLLIQQTVQVILV